MMSPSGLADVEWQNNVGDCILWRADGMPLTRAHAFVLWDWLCRLMSTEFGSSDDNAKAYDEKVTREAFLSFLLSEHERAAPADSEDDDNVCISGRRARKPGLRPLLLAPYVWY